ncbi:MAG: UDP-3-O-(3-hydroxymyristoyl)glucosamine N-acyltransferase [Candidatus Omnitrophica bacterium]|nr:UDP-3-O-(3-hydroxymyristoyl)glucosamine N-acyltransferase [Candidatus Omnitrophota bacterium]
MQKTLKEVASLINGEIVGDENIIVTGICGIKEAKEGDLTFVANSRYLPLMGHTRASAIITSRDVKTASKTIIRTENPSLAFAKMVSLLAPNEVRRPKGIHPTAIIGDKVKIGKNVAIDPYAVIEDNVEIKDNTVLYAGVYVGHHTKIGKNCIIYPYVIIRERVVIGDRVVIHGGTVIGSDGFGFSTVQGVHHRIPQIGTVIIEDDVEIGANVTIDRARFDKTIIGKGTKIDNLVQIAHNVSIGENSIIVAQSGISGSANIGKNVTIAGQSGVIGHITIGDNVVVAAQSGVTKSIPSNTCVSGYPAKPHVLAKKIHAFTQNLPSLFKKVKQLEEEIAKLKSNTNDERRTTND